MISQFNNIKQEDTIAILNLKEDKKNFLLKPFDANEYDFY